MLAVLGRTEREKGGQKGVGRLGMVVVMIIIIIVLQTIIQKDAKFQTPKTHTQHTQMSH